MELKDQFKSILADYPAVRQALERVRQLPLSPEMHAFYDKAMVGLDQSFADFQSAFPDGIAELEKLNASNRRDLDEAKKQLAGFRASQTAAPAAPAAAPGTSPLSFPGDYGAILREELLQKLRPAEEDDRIAEDPGSIATAWNDPTTEGQAPPDHHPRPTVHRATHSTVDGKDVVPKTTRAKDKADHNADVWDDLSRTEE